MPGGHSTFFGFLNTFVHIVMYTYYMMAAIGPEMQKYLWWKKYLTILQMIQFIGIMTHAFQLFFNNPCNYSMALAYWIGAHAIMFFFLFRNFYKQAYAAKKVKKESNGSALNGSANGYYTTNKQLNNHCDKNGNHAYNAYESSPLRPRVTTQQ